MKWSSVVEVFVIARAVPSLLARSRDLSTLITKSSPCTSANVPRLLRPSIKVCDLYLRVF